MLVGLSPPENKRAPPLPAGVLSPRVVCKGHGLVLCVDWGYRTSLV